MRIHQSLAVLLGLLLAGAYPSRATTVFNDTFAGGSTINNATPTPANPSLGATAYQQVSSKTFSPNPPTLVSGALTNGIVSTSSGFNSIEALFAKYPVALANTGDYVEATIVFKSQGGIITAQATSTLFFGLYNANQIQPKPGGLNATSNAALAGYAASWQGYCSRIFYTGGNSGIYSRPAQTDAGTNNQDLLFQYASAAGVGSTSASTLAAFTTGASYTEVFRITKASATTLTISSTLYSGVGTGGTQLFTQSGTSTSILTNTFDALSIGWRATGSVVSKMDLNSVKIDTNAATTIIPVIETAPLAQTKGVGESVDLSVVANGGGIPATTGLSYQWFKDNVAITLGANATAQSATLNIPSAVVDDAGSYKVTVTNVAGSVTSTPVALTISAGAIAPSIVTHPGSVTLLVGGSNTFSVLANGTATLTYQWQFSTDGGANFGDISGATSTSYAINSAVLGDAGQYRCVVTNGQGSATSNAAVLIVNQAPFITVQPVGATLSIGDPLSLSVTAGGTPTPTYQWKKNGVNISGATAASYSVGGVTGAATANYTVVVTNSVNSVTSSAAAVAVLSPSFATTTVTPASAATGRNPDTRLAITFNAAVTPGVSGFLKICDASNDAVVDTIDFAAATTLRDSLRAVSTLSTLNLPVQNKSIGGTANFNYYPLTISGNTVTIYPRNGVLGYGKSYYVKIDAGAFVNSSGEAFAGISNNSTWAFSTKAAGPATGTTALTVATDGTGDFDTVQGAIDWVPASNAAPLVISIKNGSYFEQVVFTNKNFLTLLGQDRTQTSIVYPNNNNFNNVGGGIYHRATFIGSGVHDITVENLKFNNTTPQNGSQAEAFILSGSATFTAHNIVTKCNLYSYQDTLQVSRQCYISDCYIEGDTDFMWGGGPCFFENCDIKILRTGGYFAQIRNDSTSHGFVYNNCRFTAGSGFSGNYLNRIDPRSANFPNSEMVLMNCKIGDATNNAFLNTSVGVSGSDYKGGWWLLNGTNTPATDALNIRNWDYSTTDGTGLPLTFASRPAFTVMPTDSTTIANYSSAFWVLNTSWAGVATGTWTPSVLPTFLTQPQQGPSVAVGTAVTFSADVAAVPAATYQWYLNDTPISGATASSYAIPAAGGADWGTYKLIATTTGGSTTSSLVTLTPSAAPISNPTGDGDGDGFNDLMEYGFGTNPGVSSGSSIVYASGVVSAHGQPTISVTNITNGVDFRAVFGRRRNYLAAGLTYTVQFSASDLGNWVNSSTVPTVLATDGEIDAVSVPYPLFIVTPNGVEKPQFYRVGVSSN